MNLFSTASFETQIQRVGEDQDDWQHVHGGRGIAAWKRRRASGQFNKLLFFYFVKIEYFLSTF